MIPIAVLLSSPLLAATAAPSAQAASAPPVVRHQYDDAQVSYRLKIRPGVPQPGQVAFVVVEIAKPLSTPHPTYGRRLPLDDAAIQAVLVAPGDASHATAKPRVPAGRRKLAEKPWMAARQGLKLRDAGSYGFSFTVPEEGVYGLHLRGSSQSAGPLQLAVPVAVGIWPTPEATPVPAAPAQWPDPAPGDMAHGRTLCTERCATHVAGAYPTGKTPAFLASPVAAAMDDAALLAAVVGDAQRSLSEQQRNDLLLYLRSLHVAVDDLFPEVDTYVAGTFTINEHGRRRLKESAKLQVSDSDATATVFVAFGGESTSKAPTLVSYDDRLARDRLDRKRKLGYLVFFDMQEQELAMALGREPEYPIVGLMARDRQGERPKSLNQKLRSFVGKGRFNDPRSLAQGSKALRTTLTPLYLRAAELATMYYANEREFSAFDEEFETELEPQP